MKRPSTKLACRSITAFIGRLQTARSRLSMYSTRFSAVVLRLAMLQIQRIGLSYRTLPPGRLDIISLRLVGGSDMFESEASRLRISAARIRLPAATDLLSTPTIKLLPAPRFRSPASNATAALSCFRDKD